MKSQVFAEIADASRRNILAELRRGPRTVSELVSATGLKQPNVSNHLARLRDCGLVEATKRGRLVFYALNDPRVEAALGIAANGLCTRAHDPISLATYVERYAEAAVRGEEAACVAVVDELLALHVDLVTLYSDVLGPAMARVGDGYVLGEIDEGQEHLASAITERAMARIVHFRTKGVMNERLALLGCSAGNLHTLGLRMLSDYLASEGWEVRFLGANVPHQAFLEAELRYEPEIVLVSCGARGTEEACESLVRALSDRKPLRPDLRVGVGGRCALEAAPRFLEAGADFTARDLREFAAVSLPSLAERRRPPGANRL
ncbi:MAG: metalloregulator ArsR/SmtB family transcription factor [Fimbriimonadaceae bacterium]|nr:metalloregulator ArsR/SmtB family transcription factor [Fimbriimonadaceae bacterium]